MLFCFHWHFLALATPRWYVPKELGSIEFLGSEKSSASHSSTLSMLAASGSCAPFLRASQEVDDQFIVFMSGV